MAWECRMWVKLIETISMFNKRKCHRNKSKTQNVESESALKYTGAIITSNYLILRFSSYLPTINIIVLFKWLCDCDNLVN